MWFYIYNYFLKQTSIFESKIKCHYFTGNSVFLIWFCHQSMILFQNLTVWLRTDAFRESLISYFALLDKICSQNCVLDLCGEDKNSMKYFTLCQNVWFLSSTINKIWYHSEPSNQLFIVEFVVVHLLGLSCDSLLLGHLFIFRMEYLFMLFLALL